jgi:hypothetical protein
MKYSLLIFSLLTCSLCHAQRQEYTIADMPFEIDSTTGGLVYRGVVEVPNVSVDELYGRARAFLTKAFTNTSAIRTDNRSQGTVIQVDDRAGGLVAGKGILQPNRSLLSQSMGPAVSIVTPFEIRFKDGRYRYELSNLQMLSGNVTINYDELIRKNSKRFYKPMSENEYRRNLKGTEPVTDFIGALRKAMQQKEPGKDF